METAIGILDWFFTALLVWAAVIDARTRRIQPQIVYAMFALAAAKILLEILSHDMMLAGLWAALIAGIVTTLAFWLMYRFLHGIGLGDVKLMAAVGFFFSIRGVFTIVFFSMLFTALVGVIMVIRDRKNLKAELPFAPFVATAAVLREVILLANRVWV